MGNRQRVWLWLAAAASFVVGLVLVFNDSGAGWFLVIMGITYLGASTRVGQEMAATNPGLARWGLTPLHCCSFCSPSLWAQSCFSRRPGRSAGHASVAARRRGAPALATEGSRAY